MGREDLENHSKNKWLGKSQRLLVLRSKFTGLKLFTQLGPVPCPLWVTTPLPTQAKAKKGLGSAMLIPHQGRFPNEGL